MCYLPLGDLWACRYPQWMLKAVGTSTKESMEIVGIVLQPGGEREIRRIENSVWRAWLRYYVFDEMRVLFKMV